MPGNLHIGTSGWSYKHWHHIFYPDEVKPPRYLEYYFTHFDCVELNTSFYHLPLKTTVEGWMNRTPDHFIFCPKLSRYVTHLLRLLNTEQALERFFDIFSPMKKKMGPVLIQLPPGMLYDQDRVETFFGILRKKYKTYHFAIEIRHKSWINDVFFNMLQKYGIAFTIADSGNRYPYYEKITAGFTYVRFHGDGQLYSSNYNEIQLDYYSAKIAGWLSEGTDVWVFFNNDVHGYAIQNAMRLRELTGARIAV